MEEEKRFNADQYLLGFFPCLLLCVILYDAQVVNKDAYLAKSSSQVTTTSGGFLPGIITDRNGKVLVSNGKSTPLPWTWT